MGGQVNSINRSRRYWHCGNVSRVGETIRVRPKELSGDRVADIDVLAHALRFAEHQDNVTYDVVLMLQPTSSSEVLGAILIPSPF